MYLDYLLSNFVNEYTYAGQLLIKLYFIIKRMRKRWQKLDKNIQTSEIFPAPRLNHLNSTREQIYIQLPRQKQEVPYFRTQDYNVEAYCKYRKQRSFQTPDKQKKMSKISNLISDLIQKHKQTKQRLQKLKEQKQKQGQRQLMNLSFHPKIKHNARYKVKGTLTERNKSWDDTRAQKYLSIRQEQTAYQCKQCTFTPKLAAKRQSQTILKKKQMQMERLNEIEREQKGENEVIQKFEKIAKIKLFNQNLKTTNGFDYRAVQDMIHYEMGRIKI